MGSQASLIHMLTELLFAGSTSQFSPPVFCLNSPFLA